MHGKPLTAVFSYPAITPKELVPSPRVIAICVFRHDSRILVAEGFDEYKGERFLRPIGGEVELGESTSETVTREVREELGKEIQNAKRLAVLENMFQYNGKPGHEIVFVFDAEFIDKTLYEMNEIPINEDVWVGPARWIDLDRLPDAPLYPDGLAELLTL